ncbi:hypothetical protein N7476_000342 [Penicillium atrosanguineum]|uniref:Uncharacterized protein n=1 Tax=Penicillium atrosanguineum TaxID=1132637 RepID=A0A9W9UCM9_9EURO|nr:hypothetical protein N7476_000342 [Penicillium atrosanguineum]
MPVRRNPSVTADGLLHNLVVQMERLLKFLEVDLTPVIVGNSATGEGPSPVDLMPHGASSRPWILHLQTILWWSSLALEEERWLQTHGLDRALPGNHIRGVWSMPSFLRHLGLTNDHNVRSDLQQGRKLRRLETKFGAGIVLLMVPVMPSFRRLSLGEEAKVVQLLEADYSSILLKARMLSNLRMKYQTLVPRPSPVTL